MVETMERLKAEASQLPNLQRAKLAYFLLQSLDEEEEPGAEAAWDAELNRRLTDIQNNRVQGRPADEVFARLQAKHT